MVWKKSIWRTSGVIACGSVLGLSLLLSACGSDNKNPDMVIEQSSVELSLLGQYQSGIYLQSAAEIVSYDPVSQRAFVINAASGEVDILDLNNPANPTLISSIDVSDLGGDANSVAVKNEIVAIAVEGAVRTDNGFVALYDTDGNRLNVVGAGALPDALTFSPDGRYLLVANEGEPAADYSIDPEGSVTIIDLAGGVLSPQVLTADFQAFNGREVELRAMGVRIFGPGASAAQDFEPEWVEVSADSRTAYVSMQENNAIAVIDIETATVTDIFPLGFKDWSAAGTWSGNGLDVSRRDGINIRHWPLYGVYQPDTVRLYEVGGETYIVTANEGDARDYEGSDGWDDNWWSEEFEVRRLQLDPVAFPDAALLKERVNMGDLRVTSTLGFVEGSCNPSLSTTEVVALGKGYNNIRDYVHAECVYEKLYAFGGRSMSIFRVTAGGLELVYDTASQMEDTTAATYPDFFNADHQYRAPDSQFDRRSANKGPEPEGVAIGEIDGRTYAFIGLERIGGVMVYDITEPKNTEFVQYINNRDFSLPNDPALLTATDLGAEGLHFIPANDSPDSEGRPLLLVGNEVSGTTTIFAIDLIYP